jgi:antitoxin component of RelBE/YafQ-DinJ toxin-antitoxin module
MAKVRTSINIDEELNKRWNDVSKRLDITKSSMVSEFLEEVLPILEKETPNDIMKLALKKTAEQIDLTASLFD